MSRSKLTPNTQENMFKRNEIAYNFSFTNSYKTKHILYFCKHVTTREKLQTLKRIQNMFNLLPHINIMVYKRLVIAALK